MQSPLDITVSIKAWVVHTFALQARDILIDHGQSKDLMKAAAYWKKGAANFHERI